MPKLIITVFLFLVTLFTTSDPFSKNQNSRGLYLNAQPLDEEPSLSFFSTLSMDLDELSKNEKNEIEAKAREYFDLMRNSQFSSIWEDSVPVWQQTFSKENYSLILAQVSEQYPVAKNEEIELKSGRKAIFSQNPSNGQLVLGEELDQNSPEYLQYLALPENKIQVVLTFVADSPYKSETLVILLGKESEEQPYKFSGIYVGTSAINGHDGSYFLAKAQKWQSEGKELPAFFALNFAYRLSYRGGRLTTGINLRSFEQLTLLQQKEGFTQRLERLAVGDLEYSIINYDVVETRKELTPSVAYLSDRQLVAEEINVEANLLYQELAERYPEFIQVFPILIFQAYNDFPTDASIKYELYRSVVGEKESSEEQ